MAKSGAPESGGANARLEAQIEEARNNLAETIDAIAERVAPKNVAAEAKSKARSFVVDEDGSMRTDRVVKIAAVAGIVLVIGLWRRYH